MFLNTPAQKPVRSSDCPAVDTATRTVLQFTRPAHDWFFVCVLALDRRLRRILKISEFSDRADCILRFAYVRSQNDVQLGDGSEIHKGDRIIELHLWNEHLSMRRNPSRSLGNAAELRRRLRISLELLGEQMITDQRSDDIKGCHARMVLNFRGRETKLIAVARHYGFECVSSPPGLAQRCHDLLENLLIYGLIWAFNRRLLKKSVGRLSRADLWMSRNQFLALYGRPLIDEMESSKSGCVPSDAVATGEGLAAARTVGFNSRPPEMFTQERVDDVYVYETACTADKKV